MTDQVIETKYTEPLGDMLEQSFPHICHEKKLYEHMDTDEIETSIAKLVHAMKKC